MGRLGCSMLTQCFQHQTQNLLVGACLQCFCNCKLLQHMLPFLLQFSLALAHPFCGSFCNTEQKQRLFMKAMVEAISGPGDQSAENWAHWAGTCLEVFSFPFFFHPILLRYNCHMLLYKFKVYSLMVWLKCVVMWFPNKFS